MTTPSTHAVNGISPPLTSSPLDQRLVQLREAILANLIERDVPVRLALLAAIAGEHLLLIGPPGTAKSLVARRLRLAFKGAAYFERLLTRFSVPEELFGPLSIKGLENDRYERLTDSYLPKASIAFLDEIFKANSAILNALLTLLNEREFDNGARRERTPLIAAVGASNELPEGEELDALFDRFLLRVHVGPVSKAAFPLLIGLRGDAVAGVPEELRLSTDDLSAVRKAAEGVVVPDDVVSLLSELREWCLAEKIPVSDRRWRKIVKLLQTSAFTNGRDAVSIWDCWLLQHCIWSEPEQQHKVYDWYAGRVGASKAMDPSKLKLVVVSWESQLKQDQDSRSQRRNAKGRLLYKGNNGKPTPNSKGEAQVRRDNEPLFLAPSNAFEDAYGHHQVQDRSDGGKGFTRTELDTLWVGTQQSWNNPRFSDWPDRDTYLANKANWLMEEAEYKPLMEPTRHKVTHVEACLKEVGGLRRQVEAYEEKLEAHIASLDTDIRAHLWVTDDFAEPAKQSLAGTRREVGALLVRIDKLRQGFEMLPREALLDPDAQGDHEEDDEEGI